MDQSCKKLASVPCNSCVRREGSLGPCKTLAKELPCMKWNTTCATFENVCAKHENFCKNETMVCYDWGQECVERAPSVCESWTKTCPAGSMAGYAFDKKEWCGTDCVNKCGGTWGNPCCKSEGGYGWEECELRCKDPEETCAKHSPDSCIKFAPKCLLQKKECVQWEQQCADRANVCKETREVCEEYGDQICLEYHQIPSGMFCNDTGTSGHCCDICAGADKIGKTLNMVFAHSVNLEQKALFGGEKRTPQLLAILKLTVETMSGITGKIMEKQKSQTSTNTSGTTTTTPTPTTTTIEPESPGEENEENDQLKAEIDLPEELELMKKFLPPQKNQIAVIAVSNKEAIQSQLLMENFIQYVNAWTDNGMY